LQKHKALFNDMSCLYCSLEISEKSSLRNDLKIIGLADAIQGRSA